MKKIVFLFSLMVISLMASARVAYYPGTIHFKDGSSVDYPAIAIPGPAAKEIVVSTDAKHKDKQKLPAEDIFSIALWHQDHPDKVGHLYPLVIAKSNGDTYTRICLLEHLSEWGAILQLGDSYMIDKQGSLYGIVMSINGSVPQISHYLLKNNEELAVLLYVNQSWKPRKAQAAQHFAANKEIADGITSGKYKPKDINYILDAMSMSEGGNGNAAIDDDDDEDMPKKKAVASGDAASTNRKHKGYGIDDAYDLYRSIGVEYVTFFSKNQQAMLTYDWNVSFFTLGAHAGVQLDDLALTEQKWVNHEFAGYDTTYTNKPTLIFGLHFGGQLPIQLGDYYLIPQIKAGINFTPISMFKDNTSGMVAELPFSVGTLFSIPLGNGALNLGVHYVYELGFCPHDCRLAFNNNRKRLNPEPAPDDFNASLLVISGQSGLRVSVAWAW